MFNFTCHDASCLYKHVPTKLVPRSQVPHHADLKGSVLAQNGDFDSLLRSALKRGISITVPQIKSIIGTLRLPPLKTGSGKSGGVLKRDMVRQILENQFPDDSEEEIARMLDLIAPLPKKKNEASRDKEMDHDSLEYIVSCLDEDNAQEFKHLVEHAHNQLLSKARDQGKEEVMKEEYEAKISKQMKEAESKSQPEDLKQELPKEAARVHCDRDRSRTPFERRSGVTARDFKSLFPKSGGIHGMSCKHDRTKRFCQVVFPCHSAVSIVWLLWVP